MTRILVALIALYKRWLSPAIHTLGVGGCRFQPTCSEYAMRAIAMHGPLRGSVLAVWRVLRCNPFSRGGLDQVPPAHSVSHRDGASFQEAVAKNSSSPSEGGAEEQVVPLPHPRTLAEKPLP